MEQYIPYSLISDLFSRNSEKYLHNSYTNFAGHFQMCWSSWIVLVIAITREANVTLETISVSVTWYHCNLLKKGWGHLYIYNSPRTCSSHLCTCWDVDRSTYLATSSPLSRWLMDVHAFGTLTFDHTLTWFGLVIHVTTNFLWFVVNQFSSYMMWTTVIILLLHNLQLCWSYSDWRIFIGRLKGIFHLGENVWRRLNSISTLLQYQVSLYICTMDASNIRCNQKGCNFVVLSLKF